LSIDEGRDQWKSLVHAWLSEAADSEIA